MTIAPDPHRRPALVWLAIALLAAAAATTPARAEDPDADGIALFESKIRPVLIDRSDIQDRELVVMEILEVKRIFKRHVDDCVGQVEDRVEQAHQRQFISRRTKRFFEGEIIRRSNADWNHHQRP